jgi:hypothetical protein
LWLNGADLRKLRLIERKKKLKRLIERSSALEIIYAQHVERYGKLHFEEVCDRNLEGVACKRNYAEYGWVKIKDPKLHAGRRPPRPVHHISHAAQTHLAPVATFPFRQHR